MSSRAFWSLIVVGVFLPGAARAQPDTGSGTGHFWHHKYPPGPRVAPAWSYPGITGGAYITYADPPNDLLTQFLVRHPIRLWDPSNGLSLCGPAVPVYGPLPTVADNPDLKREWRSMNHPGLAKYGLIGLYSALPRPRYKSVSVWPTPGDGPAPAPAPAQTEKGGGTVLTVTVKVPQPGAEVLVDGKPTSQTGTDRTFESPPLTAGTRYKYTVTARWMEGGQPVERVQDAVGTAGEVVRLEFSK
jgi:uncharacterized protein (TIGR03000 family)